MYCNENIHFSFWVTFTPKILITDAQKVGEIFSKCVKSCLVHYKTWNSTKNRKPKISAKVYFLLFILKKVIIVKSYLKHPKTERSVQIASLNFVQKKCFHFIYTEKILKTEHQRFLVSKVEENHTNFIFY